MISSIYNISHNDIKEFLKVNAMQYNNDDAYDIAFDSLRKGK